MIQIEKYITEKLKINTNTKVGYTDDELREDWQSVWNSFSLSDKKPYKEKYGVNSNKKEDIQQEISLRLRDNRQNKKSFDEKDVKDFHRLQFKEKELYDYLDKEPLEFVETLLEYWENRAIKRNILKWAPVYNSHNLPISYNDKYVLATYMKIKKYLSNKK